MVKADVAAIINHRTRLGVDMETREDVEGDGRFGRLLGYDTLLYHSYYPFVALR